MIAAALGDTDAAHALQPVLDRLSADPDGTALARAFRGILTGTRAPGALLTDLRGDEATLVQVILEVLEQHEHAEGEEL